MNRVFCVVGLVLLAGGSACAAEGKAKGAAAPLQHEAPPAATPSPGKLQAPVGIAASVAASSAKVTVSFDADATGVTVDVRGVDGLQVTSTASPVVAGTFARGSTVAFDVAFAAPAGQSNLAVAVSGVFGGVRGAKIASFTVGVAPPQKPAGVVPGPAGERILELPAQTR